MLKAHYVHYPLIFKTPAGTSRGVLHSRDTWFIFVYNEDSPNVVGIGECGLIPGLSPDSPDKLPGELEALCRDINFHKIWAESKGKLFPSINFALETALFDLENQGKRIFHNNTFSRGEDGIPVNGLIWMGDHQYMHKQLRQKIDEGFTCIKIKIGASSFNDDIELIRAVRKEYDQHTIQIRVDANGAFTPEQAPEILQRLAEYHIHSIEQPIFPGQHQQMAALCLNPAIPVALDEELIGIYEKHEQQDLLETIRPQYIILKPGLIGGFEQAQSWIKLADKLDIGWWVTSALESNIGLNAIAQWTFKQSVSMIQGLGTGQLYTNNFPSPLIISKAHLYHQPQMSWDLKAIGYAV